MPFGDPMTTSLLLLVSVVLAQASTPTADPSGPIDIPVTIAKDHPDSPSPRDWGGRGGVDADTSVTSWVLWISDSGPVAIPVTIAKARDVDGLATWDVRSDPPSGADTDAMAEYDLRDPDGPSKTTASVRGVWDTDAVAMGDHKPVAIPVTIAKAHESTSWNDWDVDGQGGLDADAPPRISQADWDAVRRLDRGDARIVIRFPEGDMYFLPVGPGAFSSPVSKTEFRTWTGQGRVVPIHLAADLQANLHVPHGADSWVVMAP